jgi:hypothetical protein
LSPPLRETTAQEILDIIRSRRGDASFNTILAEAQAKRTLTWHRTLRRYLDILVQGRVLSEKRRDVGSVNLQQIYRITGAKPQVQLGPKILQLHGLNWDTPQRELYTAQTDMTGLLRAKPATLNDQEILAGSREDNLATEIYRDAEESTGTIELVVAIIATQTIDLPYFLRRTDEFGVGRAARLLYKKLIKTFTGTAPPDADGKIFLATRERFLQIMRQYSQRRFLSLLETPSKGPKGARRVESLTPANILNLAGKQLGITG